MAEDRQSVLRATLLKSNHVETPSVAQWRDFGAGPRAGERAPDVELSGDQPGERLFDVLRGTRHQLLLFDGAAATAEGYENLADIASAVVDRYRGLIAVHVVMPADVDAGALPWQGSIIADHECALHERYGAGAECLYLIRPDGYIGYRAQPADRDKLFAYLARIFN